MMEVYDRVLASRSIPTLVGLSIIARRSLRVPRLFRPDPGAHSCPRRGVAGRGSEPTRLPRLVAGASYARVSKGTGKQPLRDLDQVRSFLASGGPSALFDLPWMPLYLFICFAFHPWIGVTALGGAAILVSLTILTESSRRKAARKRSERAASATLSPRPAAAMPKWSMRLGMARASGRALGRSERPLMALQRKTSDVAGGFAAPSRRFCG